MTQGTPRPFWRPTRSFLLTLVLLGLALVPTVGGGRLRAGLRTLHTLTPVYSDRNAQPTGYYVGLIDGAAQSRDELTLRLVGKPPETINFAELGAARFLPGDFLQFELKPNVDSVAFGSRFTTNALGLRDRPCTVEKPAGVTRIVLLGSSMDMGWGVSTDETYENRLEDWLNAHAVKRGLNRRFEILNFAVAAYGPLHRLETLRRKVFPYQPDLVLYSATRLDTRLLQLHIVNALNEGTAIPDAFVRESLERSGIPPVPPASAGTRPKPLDKEVIKERLDPNLWTLNDATLAEIAGLCKERGLPLACLIIPRASETDSPDRRGPDVAHITRTAQDLALPVLDLTPTFDTEEAADVEIAPWDDHPNALGHRLLFLAIGQRLLTEPTLYHHLFGVEPEPTRGFDHRETTAQH